MRNGRISGQILSSMSCHWDWEIEIVKHHLRLEVSYSSSTALVGKTGFMPWTMQLRLREIHSPNYLPLLPPAIALLASNEHLRFSFSCFLQRPADVVQVKLTRLHV